MPVPGNNVAEDQDRKKVSFEVSDAQVDAASSGQSKSKDGRLPVTLLSGFLGAGKTSLLMHILKNKAGLRCAILVNDMAELNVDANLVRDGGVVQVEEELVEMQNGCICCTLRADLVVEVAKLARQKRFDYLVIESTGISEPMQVAETFLMPVPIDTVVESIAEGESHSAPDDVDGNMREATEATAPSSVENDILEGADSASPSAVKSLKPLASLARLDTCVTVIDVANFDQTMTSVMTLREGEYSRVRRGGVAGAEIPDEDDRTLVDLMVDQIEFADSIILNKIDISKPSQVEYVKKVVKTLNPSAELLTSVKGAVPLAKVLGTRSFNLDNASELATWKKDVAEIEAGVVPKPETEEYGVSSFVFKSLRPFHSERLYKFANEHFLMTVAYPNNEEEVEIEEPEDDDGDNEEEGDSHSEVTDLKTNANGNGTDAKEAEGKEGEKETDEEGAEMLAGIDKRQKQHSSMKELCKADFGGVLLRSKGHAWITSSPYFPVVWSQAGAYLTLSQMNPWESEVEGAERSADEVEKKTCDKLNGNKDSGACGLEKDDYAMHGLDEAFWLGDKCTELVLIGHQIDKVKLRRCLESCLLTNDEVARLGAPTAGRGGWCTLEDDFGFPVLDSPPVIEADDEYEDEEEEEGDVDDCDGEKEGCSKEHEHKSSEEKKRSAEKLDETHTDSEMKNGAATKKVKTTNT